MASSRSSKESTQTSSKVSTVSAAAAAVASTNNAPPTNNNANTSAAAACDRLIKIDDIQPAASSLDVNNNTNKNVSSAEAVVSTTTTHLTSTISETGPQLKVVVSPQRGPVELLHSAEGATIIYTDASLLKNGTAGIGCYFGKDHPLNTDQRLPGTHKSSGWAEIIAATIALQKLRGWSGYKKAPVIVRTDHLMIVEAMQMKRITENTHPKFFVELQALKKIAQDFPQGVQFEHVYAHNGDEGNEAADALATKATSNNNLPSPRRTRSKPPSRHMLRRTRSAYIKRSAPPEVHGIGKKDVKKLSAAAAQPYIPAPSAVALRDIKQMEMGVEKTQSERSSRDISVTGSLPTTVDGAKTEVRDETVKATQSLTQNSPAAEAPKAKTPASRFVSRFSRQSLNRTPSPVRAKDPQQQLHNGRPITWAPKKSQATRSPKFAAAANNKDYNEHEKRKIAAAEKMYSAEAAGNQIMAAMEEFQENEDKQAELRSDIRKRCSSSRKAKEVAPSKEKNNNNAAAAADAETPIKRSEKSRRKSQKRSRKVKKDDHHKSQNRSRKSKRDGKRKSRK